MSAHHLFAIEEAPHVEAELPAAENHDRTIRLHCTLCKTAQAFDSDGMVQESVRERLVSFAMEHEACPLAALPSRYPGGSASFVTYAMALGFSYAFYARKTQSVRWCAVSHSLHDALGLGALIYSGWLT